MRSDAGDIGLLRWRLLLGGLFIAALAALVWLDLNAERPGSWLIWLAIALGCAAAGEMVRLIGAAGIVPLSTAIYAGTLLVIGSNAVPLFLHPVPDELPLERLAWPALAVALSLPLAMLDAMRRYRQPGTTTASLGAALLAVLYVGLNLAFAVQLRVLGSPRIGLVALVSTIVIVKMGDIGAYTIGRLFGRHKMAPLISPGKTMEGAAGALGFACLGAWLALRYLPGAFGVSLAMPAPAWFLLGVVVGGAGLLGDLAESLLKRDAGVKDSSEWLPGFGGVLDLLDSVLFVMPLAYLCWLILLN